MKYIPEIIIKSIDLQNKTYVDSDGNTQPVSAESAYLLPLASGEHERYVSDSENTLSRQSFKIESQTKIQDFKPGTSYKKGTPVVVTLGSGEKALYRIKADGIATDAYGFYGDNIQPFTEDYTIVDGYISNPELGQPGVIIIPNDMVEGQRIVVKYYNVDFNPQAPTYAMLRVLQDLPKGEYPFDQLQNVGFEKMVSKYGSSNYDFLTSNIDYLNQMQDNAVLMAEDGSLYSFTAPFTETPSYGYKDLELIGPKGDLKSVLTKGNETTHTIKFNGESGEIGYFKGAYPGTGLLKFGGRFGNYYSNQSIYSGIDLGNNYPGFGQHLNLIGDNIFTKESLDNIESIFSSVFGSNISTSEPIYGTLIGHDIHSERNQDAWQDDGISNPRHSVMLGHNLRSFSADTALDYQEGNVITGIDIIPQNSSINNSIVYGKTLKLTNTKLDLANIFGNQNTVYSTSREVKVSPIIFGNYNGFFFDGTVKTSGNDTTIILGRRNTVQTSGNDTTIILGDGIYRPQSKGTYINIGNVLIAQDGVVRFLEHKVNIQYSDVRVHEWDQYTYEVVSTPDGTLGYRPKTTLTSSKNNAFPDSPTEGDIFYNTADKKHYGYDGTKWNAFY